MPKRQSSESTLTKQLQSEVLTVGERLDRASRLAVLVRTALDGIAARVGEIGFPDDEREAMRLSLGDLHEHLWLLRDNLRDGTLGALAPTPDQRDALAAGGAR
jgi:hypothetical protein